MNDLEEGPQSLNLYLGNQVSVPDRTGENQTTVFCLGRGILVLVYAQVFVCFVSCSF